MQSMKTETNQSFTWSWRSMLPSMIGEENAERLNSAYDLAGVQHRTDWRAMWALFDAAREDGKFTLTSAQWDDVEQSIVVLGGVNTRAELAEPEEEE